MQTDASVDTPRQKERLLASDKDTAMPALAGREMERSKSGNWLCARASTNCIPILGNGARSPYLFLWFSLAQA